MQRAPLGLTKALGEVWMRATTPAKVRGGAKLPHTKPHLHHTHPHPHTTAPAAPQVTSAASATHPAGAFIRSITDGVFKSIKSSSYAHPKGPYSGTRLPPRPSTTSPFASAPRRAATKSPRFGMGGPSPRPALRSNTAQMGLGAARNFSSAGHGVFANVVANVPLGLRALSGVGVDERKWKGVRRGLRKEMKVDGEQKSVGGSRMFMSKEREMERYFGVAAAVEVAVESQQQEQEHEATRLPVVLIIDVEPELSFSSHPTPTASATFDPSWRLLTPSVLSHFSTITTSYESHAHRIRALHHRLLDAGVFDDPETRTELIVWREHDGRERREVHVTFGDGWDVRDVRSVVGWTGGERAGAWCRVVDLQEEREGRMRESGEVLDESTLSGTATSCCTDVEAYSSEEVHHVISSTFILPDPTTTSDSTESLELSPPLSPTLTSNDTLSWNEWDMHALHEVAAQQSYGEEACPWEDAMSSTSATSMSGSYEEGVRTFLGELDSVEGRF